jgi:hypothetical protein
MMVLGGVHFTRRWNMGDHFDTPSGVLSMALRTSSASMVLFHDSASEPVTCGSFVVSYGSTCNACDRYLHRD